MKLVKIQLHPFGGTNDRTYDLNGGLNVIEGPNEYGKSTLREALWHALHTPTNLTPAKLDKTMGQWYPMPGGDHVCVNMVFEADGKTWELEKVWGAGTASRLAEQGGVALADPTKVQGKLNELLKLNEATWKQVLFAGQAELADTVEALEQAGDDVDDVQEFLSGPAAIPGDMPPEKLMQALDREVEMHYSRWDRQSDRPEGGRGIANPWRQNVGPLLQAWYAKEQVKRDLVDVRSGESDLSDVNQRIGELTEDMEADSRFVADSKKLRTPLTRRIEVEGNQEKAERTVAELMEVAKEWPRTEAQVEQKGKELKKLEKELGAVLKERANAQKHRDAQKLKEDYARISKAKETWETAKKELEAKPKVPALEVQRVEQCERQIRERDIEIRARKLAANIQAKRPLSATLQRGTASPEALELKANEPWEGEVPGRLVLETDSLTITVSNVSDVDMGHLLNARNKDVQDREKLLSQLGYKDLDAAKHALEERKEREKYVRDKDTAYIALLGHQTFVQWEEKVKALEELPKARDLGTLDELHQELITEQATAERIVEDGGKKLKKWQAAYGTVEKLIAQQVERKAELDSLNKELGKLPGIPKGYPSIQDFLEDLASREEKLSGYQQKLSEAKEKKAALEAKQSETTVEELDTELENLERTYERLRLRGEALIRIKGTVERVVKQRELASPLDGFHERVQKHFNLLTNGRYQQLAMEGSVPETATTGEITLEPIHLSQGTRGSLALALRLAHAEAYLKDSNGFMLLDDPFVDLDPDRRKAAVEAVRRFSESKQVIFFTCHPQHAQELQQRKG